MQKAHEGWVPDGEEAIIGKAHATQTFFGVIDNLRIYDRALGPEGIAALYQE